MVEVYQSDVVTSLGKLGRDNGLTATTCVVGLVVWLSIVISLFIGRIYELITYDRELKQTILFVLFILLGSIMESHNPEGITGEIEK